MEIQLCLRAPALETWKAAPSGADPFRLVSFACVRNDQEHDLREYFVVPLDGGFGPQSVRVPVYLRESGADPSLQQLLPMDSRWPAAAPPYIVVEPKGPAGATAIFMEADGLQHEVSRVRVVDTALRVDRAGADRPQPSAYEMTHGRFSRTIGALAGDYGALHQLQSARVCVIGAGRAGTALTSALVEGFGAGSPGSITLIDDDLVEASGLDAGMDTRSVGRRKVDALAGLIQQRNADTNVIPLFAPAESPAAFRALGASDVIVVGADSASARIAAALCGAAYYVPVIDIGSAVLPDDRPRRRRQDEAGPAWIAGADIRVTGPGSCLCCCGGIQEIGAPRRRSFRSHRLGSLRSLNMISCGIGINLLLTLLTTQTPLSPTHVRLEMTAMGEVTARTNRIENPRSVCPICRVWMGRADELFEEGWGEEGFELPF